MGMYCNFCMRLQKRKKGKQRRMRMMQVAIAMVQLASYQLTSIRVLANCINFVMHVTH